jgi:ankyrin repeat protein
MSAWYAARDGDLAEVQRLVERYPRMLHAKNISMGGLTPLMLAAGAGHLEVARWLVDRGAAVDEQDRTGGTALCMASKEGRTPVVRLLLERGADPTVLGAHHSVYPTFLTPLMISSYQGHVETVLCLLDHPSGAATINQSPRGGCTALSLACQRVRVDVVKALLQNGADPTIGNGRAMFMAKENERLPFSTHDAGRTCVEALEVRCALGPFHPRLLTGLT